MLNPGATEAELEAAERSHNLRLPPSYREFLRASSGLRLPAYCRFVSCSEVIAYPQANPSGYEALLEYREDVPSPPNDEYFVYGTEQDGFCIRPEYAASALALNGPAPGSFVASKEFGWVLLVREVSFPGGEHEIWEHDSWSNRRFTSFADYFASARVAIIESLRSVGAP